MATFEFLFEAVYLQRNNLQWETSHTKDNITVLTAIEHQ